MQGGCRVGTQECRLWGWVQEGCSPHPPGHSVASPEGRVPTGSSTLTYEVVLGEYDMSIAEGPEQRIPVASSDIFVHPKWRSSCVACG